MDEPQPSQRSTATIEGWRVDLKGNRLTRADEVVRLEPRAMDVLCCLIEQAGEVVTRRFIEDEVWRGAVVGYDVLSHSIAKLRKAFDDDPRAPRIIETIPKVGYRLMAPVEWLEPAVEAASLRRSRLAVILHADVVGSTALVRKDEVLAHDRIRTAFERFSATIETHHGSVNEVRGDALVAEFARASDAVLAALAAQADNVSASKPLDDDIVPEMRVGIAIGEVVIADNTVTGAGVIIAQRVEQLAEPGGVCVQGSVYEAISGALPVDFSYLGEQTLKGFDDPIRAYAVAPRSVAARPGPETPVPGEAGVAESPLRWGNPVARVAWSAVALAVCGALLFIQPWKEAPDAPSSSWETAPVASRTNKEAFQSPASGQRTPDKPSIAVLAFDNLSDDAQQDYFAEGIALDLITDLSKVPGLLVMSQDSSFSFRGKDIPAKEVARQLDVAYILDGSVRRAGDQLRLNVSLITASSDSPAWAERFDGSTKDVFGFQDRVVSAVTAAIAKSLMEQPNTASSGRPKSFEAYEEFLKGWALRARRNAVDAKAALDHFERALQIEPDYQRAKVGKALTLWEMNDYWETDVEGFLTYPAIRSYEVMVSLLPSEDPVVLTLYANQLGTARRHTEAVEVAERALEADPNSAWTMRTLAWLHALGGRTGEATRLADASLRSDPLTPGNVAAIRGLVAFQDGRFSDAVEQFRNALSGGADVVAWQLLLAASLSYAGDPEAGREVLSRIRNRLGFLGGYHTTAMMLVGAPFSQRSLADRVAGSLGRLGVPFADQFLRTALADQVSGRELRATLLGRTVRVSVDYAGSWSEVSQGITDFVVSENGTVRLGSSEWLLPTGSTIRVENDLFCFGGADTAERCVAVFKNPDGGSAELANQYVAVTIFSVRRRIIRFSTESHSDTRDRYRRMVDSDTGEAFLAAPFLLELESLLAEDAASLSATPATTQ